MTKYNHFAKRLDDSFKSARSIYNSAFIKLEQMEKAKQDAEGWNTGNEGLKTARIARASADLIEAESAFREARKTAWTTFEKEKASIRAELAEAITADEMANPEQVDTNGLKLLDSGILTPAEMLNMAKNYSENPAMLRVVGKRATEALDKNGKNMSLDERGALNEAVRIANDGGNSILSNFDALASVATTCTGQSHGASSADPGYVTAISGKWESLSAAAVEDF